MLLIFLHQFEVKAIGWGYITCLTPVGLALLVSHLQFGPFTVCLDSIIPGPRDLDSLFRGRRFGW